ncbi:MAG: hypothetical protein ACRDVE_15300 [Actinocrinis sp.]
MEEAKIGSTLPKTDSANGLHSIARELLAEPEEVRYAVIAVDCGGVATRYKWDDNGERYTETIPAARIRAIEPLKGADANAAARLMNGARCARTGRSMLPLDFDVRDVTG